MRTTILLKNILLVVGMMMGSMSVWGANLIFAEGFETGLPTAYNATLSNAALSSGTWQVADVMRGTTGVNTGAYSCQIRSAVGAQIISPNITDGVSTVTFYVTSSTASGALQVNYSTNGGTTWTPAMESPFTGLGMAKVSKTATINSVEPNILIQFLRTGATIYLDDIHVYDNAESDCEIATLPLTISALSSTAGAVNGTGTDCWTINVHNATAYWGLQPNDNLVSPAIDFSAWENVEVLLKIGTFGSTSATTTTVFVYAADDINGTGATFIGSAKGVAANSNDYYIYVPSTITGVKYLIMSCDNATSAQYARFYGATISGDALTTSCTAPILDITTPDNETQSTVNLESEMTNFNSYDCNITEYGFVYSTDENPTIDADATEESNDLNNGLFSATLTGLSCNTQYHVRSYAKYDTDNVVYGAGTTFSTTACSSYTVSFNYGTGVNVDGISSETGSVITLPNALPSPACVASGYVFAGWSDTKATGTLPANLYTNTYTPGSSITLYAVYQKGGNYELVKSTPLDWAGEYVFVSNLAAYALSNELQTSPIQGGGTELKGEAVTIVNEIISNPDPKIVWTVEPDGLGTGNYYIHNSAGYLKIGSTTTSAAITPTGEDVFHFTLASKKNVYKVISTDHDRCFRFVRTSTGFRTYSTSSSTNNTGYCYKLTTPVYETEPSCAAPVINVSASILSDFTYVYGNGPSAEQSFTVTGFNLTDNITITAPVEYEISTGTGGSFAAASPITLAKQSDGSIVSTTIYVRLKVGLNIGEHNEGEIHIVSTLDAIEKVVSCNGDVTCATPVLSFATSPPATKDVGNANFTVTASASIGSSANIAYSSNYPAIASVDPSTGEVTIHAAGTVKITASLAADGNYCAATSIDYTFEISNPPFAVTYNAGSGECDITSDTETSAGSGITLPIATPSEVCIANGWIFAGWAEEEIEPETPTEPTTLLEAGSLYYPNGNVPLYAVYKITKGGAIELTSEDIKNLTTNMTGTYPVASASPEYYDNEYGTWEAKGISSGSKDFIQIRSTTSSNPAYIKLPALSENINTIKLDVSNGSDGNYNASLFLRSSIDGSNIGLVTVNARTATITVSSGSYTTGYIQSSAACRIRSIIINEDGTATYHTSPLCEYKYFKINQDDSFADDVWSVSADGSTNWTDNVSIPQNDNSILKITIEAGTTTIPSGAYKTKDMEIGNAGKLEVEAGTLNVTNDLIFVSTDYAAGQLQITGGTLTAGNVKVKKHFKAATWYMLSFPFDIIRVEKENGDVISVFNDDTEKVYASTYDTDERATRDYMHYESTAWKDFNGATLSANTAYLFGHDLGADQPLIFVASSLNNAATAENKNYATTITATDKGAVNQSWNLIGSPYTIGYNTSGLGIPTYVYDPATEGYSYEYIEDFGDLEPFKAFFIQAPSNPFTFTAGGVIPFKGANLPAYDQIKLGIFKDASFTDWFRIRLSDDPRVTAGYDFNIDAVKFLSNKAPQLYGKGSVADYAISVIPRAESANGIIPIAYTTPSAGIYTIKTANDLPENINKLLLIDKDENITTDLLQTPFYEFETNSVQTGIARFELRFEFDGEATKAPCVTATDNKMKIIAANKQLILQGLNALATVTLYDITGKKIDTFTNVDNDQPVPLNNPTGLYVVKVENDSQTGTAKITLK